MKKTLIVLMLFAGTLAANAELTEHAIALTLGYTQPIARLNSPDPQIDKTKLSANALNGIKIGLIYDATLIKGFGFVMNLNYAFAGKTGKWSDYYYDEKGQYIPIPRYQIKSRDEMHLLELAVDWQYKFEIAMDTWLILYSGPTIQCCLTYNSTDYFRDKLSEEEKIIASYPYSQSELNQYLRRLNVTWGIGAGFQYKRIFIRGGYDFGLINPYQKSDFHDFTDDMEQSIYNSRLTRGRRDQWQIKVGFYIWQSDN